MNAVKRQISLKGAVSFVVDNRGRSAPLVHSGIKLIATNCISNQRLYPTYEQVRFVSQETYDNWFRSHPKPGDVILTNKGSQNGAVCLVPDPVDFCIAQDMVALRANADVIDPLYLFAALRSPQVQSLIKNLNVDAVIPHFKKTDFDKLFIPLPDMSEQRQIGRLYFELSDKIELNRRMNETLEAMARAIFRDWFVDFGPTRAKQEGREPYLAPEIWSLFPDRLDDEGKPEGWKIMNLGQVTSELRRGISPSYITVGGVRVLNQKCIRNRQVDTGLSRRHDTEKRGIDGREVRTGDVLINSTGAGTLGRVAQLLEVDEPTVVDSHVTVVRADKADLSSCYLGLNLTGREAEIEALGEGSTGQTELPRSRLSLLSVLVPSKQSQHRFDNVASPLLSRIRINLRESKTLAEARDLLLPKLMSGEIRVRDAEKIVEDAA